MYGDDVGSMNLYLDASNSLNQIPIGNKTGLIGNYWTQQQLEFNFNLNVDFKIIFEGVVSLGARGSLNSKII